MKKLRIISAVLSCFVLFFSIGVLNVQATNNEEAVKIVSSFMDACVAQDADKMIALSVDDRCVQEERAKFLSEIFANPDVAIVSYEIDEKGISKTKLYTEVPVSFTTSLGEDLLTLYINKQGIVELKDEICEDFNSSDNQFTQSLNWELIPQSESTDAYWQTVATRWDFPGIAWSSKEYTGTFTTTSDVVVNASHGKVGTGLSSFTYSIVTWGIVSDTVHAKATSESTNMTIMES